MRMGNGRRQGTCRYLELLIFSRLVRGVAVSFLTCDKQKNDGELTQGPQLSEVGESHQTDRQERAAKSTRGGVPPFEFPLLRSFWIHVHAARRCTFCGEKCLQIVVL